ncbi:MAG TPA: hypothetical protein VMW47_04960 [Verrucomicrobiae bacterium]|nr:hypothetical protein [Verrucomicrobiae bacterium]
MTAAPTTLLAISSTRRCPCLRYGIADRRQGLGDRLGTAGPRARLARPVPHPVPGWGTPRGPAPWDRPGSAPSASRTGGRLIDRIARRSGVRPV